jgi:PAS domain S-box-containing protein
MANSVEDIIRILHVDDDSSVLEISKIILNDIENKFVIDVANSVDEAFEKLSSGNRYDIIISDYEMPQRNGLDFLKELKERKIKTPFVLFTGKGREEIAIKALNLGADGYYNKQGNPETVYGELAHGLTMVVKRRQAELQLMESEKKEKAILSNAPMGIATSDSNRYFLTVNKAFCTILGYSEKELYKLTFKDITYSEDLSESISNMEKLTSGEIQSFIQDKRYIRKNGVIIDGRVTVSVISDESGKPTLFVALLEDITQRKQKEKELRKKQLSIDSMLSSSNSPIFMVDRKYCYTAFNDVHSQIMKHLYGVDISLGKSLLDYMTNTEDRAIAKSNIDRALSGEFVEDEKPSGDLGFNRVWFSVRHYPVRNDSGQVEGVSVFAVDLTKSKHAEEQLRSSEECFRSLYENSYDAIALTKPEGIILSANPSACSLFGMTEEELQKVGREGVVIADERLTYATKELLKHGKARAQLTFKRKDGSTFEGEVTSSLFEDSEGTTKTSLIIRDISESKRAQLELESKYEILERIAGSIDSGLAIIGKDYRVIWANSNLKDLGFVPNKKCYEAVNRSDLCPDCGVRRIFEENVPLDIHEYKAVNSKGETALIELRVTPLKNKQGDIIGAIELAVPVNERKKIEDSLTRQQQELEIIIDSSPNIIFYKDLDGKIIQANEAFAKSINTTKKKLMGKTVFDLYSHEIAQGMTDDDHFVFRTKRPKLGIVEPYESPTGLRWIRTSKIPTFIDSEVTGLIGFSEDITEQKSAEDTLRQSKLILENSSDSIIVTDLQGNITSWNKGAENIFGYTSIEMVGRPITEVVKPQEREDVAPKQLDEVRKDKTFGNAWEGIKKDGSIVWLMLTTKLLKNEKDEPIAMVGFGKDITEFKKAEEKLVESEARFRAYVENSPVGVFVANKEGRYEYVNQGATRLLGYTEHELLNMTVTDIVFAEDIANTASEFVSLKEKGRLCKQSRFKAKGDREVFVILNAVALPNDRLIAFCEDVTLLRKAEAEVRKSHQEMTIVNEKLHVIGSLTRHDVGNKLMVAKSNMYLLRKKLKDNPDLLKYIDAIDEAFNQSSNIFDFSKIYERIGVEKPIVVAVADMFDEATKLLAHPNVEVINKTQGLSVLADSLLQQLFYNLLDNSLKHGKKVSKIELSFERNEKDSKLVYGDNGVGVPDENKVRIFSEGFTTGGSGLGLKLIKRMVEVYGWTIIENGEEGKGARFEIIIPSTSAKF